MTIFSAEGAVYTELRISIRAGFASYFPSFAKRDILVQIKTSLVQEKLLQELLTVSFPAQPLWTSSQPVNLRVLCGSFMLRRSNADSAHDTIAQSSSATNHFCINSASIAASIFRVSLIEQVTIRTSEHTNRGRYL